jgi:integrase/recombinase XerD
MASVKVVLNKNYTKQNNKSALSVRVTFKQDRRYYKKFDFDLTEKEFKKIESNYRLSELQQERYDKIEAEVSIAKEIIKELPYFTFQLFEERYLNYVKEPTTLEECFNTYIKELYQQDRVGTASSFNCAKVSINKFKNDITLVDVTVDFLNSYQSFMLKEGNSITTVGIYLRSLKAVYNRFNTRLALNPFAKSNEKNKYVIPSGNNIKKALTKSDLVKIFNHTPMIESQRMYKDFWCFLYLSNGMNVKDLCLLKHKNLDMETKTFSFLREKTKSTTRKPKIITVSLKAQSLDILNKYSQLSINSETYLFPFLNSNMSAIRQKEVVANLIKNINKTMNKIGIELDIKKTITTMSARHSFSTILRNSGVSTEFISEQLGHSSTQITDAYLDSFENEDKHIKTDALTSFL